MPGTALEAGHGSPRQKITFGKKSRKTLKKIYLPSGFKNNKIGRKKNKITIRELSRSWELLLVDINSSF